MTSDNSPETSYKIAGVDQKRDLTIVGTDGEFAEAIGSLLAEIKPSKLIETGTYKGTGTTTIISQALHDLGLTDAQFYSIEVNPKNYSRALAHVTQHGFRVRLLNGLSLPRNLLPSEQQIAAEYVSGEIASGIFVDHAPENRAEFYHRETDFSHVPDDLLGEVLREFANRADFVLLDSGGHVGFIEFQYLISRLRGPCWIALDDIFHVKHARSYRQMMTDQRFAIRTVSREKFGFCIARFTPQQASSRKESAA